MLQQKYAIDSRFQNLVTLSGEMDSELAKIDRMLTDENLFQLLQVAWSKRYPRTTKTGRNSTPVEVVLRMLALKHLRSLSYGKLIKNVSESLILRQFCRVYFHQLPTKSTLIRWANLIPTTVLKKINQRLLKIASELQITKGRNIRTDGTVVSTNIHFPSDNSLLADGIRVLSRLLQRAKQLWPRYKTLNKRLFRNCYRSARKISQRIDNLSRSRNQAGRSGRQQAYQELLIIAQDIVTRAQKVQGFLIKVKSLPAQKLAQRLSTFIARTEQVIDQTKRRIFDQEKVPSHSKIVSIFEPHTDIICRGKVDVLVEFGHKVWLDEVDGGMVSDYRVLQGNPHDSQQWAETINQHIQVFGRPPRQVSADRGVYSQFNENLATQLGVKRVILPKSGHKSNQRQQQEKKRSFVEGRRWHNGIEGRISVLKRCFGLERCLYHGEEGFERWVAWGVMAHNLTVIGRSLNHLERCQS